jgi:hypothetical protein
MSLEQIQHFLQYGDDPANRPSNPDADGLQSLIDPVRAGDLCPLMLGGYGFVHWCGVPRTASPRRLAVRCEAEDAFCRGIVNTA